MSGPKGSKNKTEEKPEVESKEAVVKSVKVVNMTGEQVAKLLGANPEKVEVQVDAKKEEIKEAKSVQLVTKALPPLGPGQAYFEDGATGHIMVGEDTKDQIWWRGGSGGKGHWINKKR